MAPPKDRRSILIASSTINGIDFVEIASVDQTTLRVHFLNQVALQGTISNVTITGGETVAVVVNPMQAGDWSSDADGNPLLTLTVAAPGDFSNYTLSLTSLQLDAFFRQATFSFKVLCPSDLDCAPPQPDCPPPSTAIPPIDYLAKDFLSFRRALSDFSALQYPDWPERSAADFGMMFMEALSALADDLSYTQDRIAAEATIETSTQRRSILNHARLVDYEPRPATAARVWLQLDVTGLKIDSGLVLSAQSPEGEEIPFETGTGLVDPQTGEFKQESFRVNPLWNRAQLQPYWWDDSQRCLRRGATEMWVENHGLGLAKGDRLLIETQVRPADPPVREIVQLIKAIEEDDALLGQAVTHLIWQKTDALQFDHDLTLDDAGSPKTILAGNLVPAVQGRRYSETFMIPRDPETALPAALISIPQAIVREGRYVNTKPDLHPVSSVALGARIPQYLYSLNVAPLAWLAVDDPDLPPLPEIFLQTIAGSWRWRRRLLDADQFESAFTIDPVRYSRIARLTDGAGSPGHLDYDGDRGDTIRFGDGTFGEIPDPDTIFQVIYRIGGGTIGNVAADAITRVDPASSVITAATNPFPATGGADRESSERVRRLAPQAFRAKQFRAVRSADYQAAAQTLPWVQRAGTVFRWTGSWLTVFTTPDPLDSEALTVAQHTQLINLLNRYRLAGYESYVPSPRYISLDLRVQVCARPDVFRGDVEAALLAALGAARQRDGTTGFFHVDRWTFGMPLERSALEAAIQNAYGVAGVVAIQYRQRGITSTFLNLPETVQIPVDAILRLDNDPSRPERGALNITVEGGK
jgi:Baseplate J-like protein